MIPTKLRIVPRTESTANQILYIHHKNILIGTSEYMLQMNNIANTLQIPTMYTKTAPPTPLDTH